MISDCLRCGPLISKAQLCRTVPLVGADYRFDGPALDDDDPVLAGTMHTLALRPGLILHRADVRDLHDMSTSLTLKPALKITVVPAGGTELALGTRELKLGCVDGGAAHGSGALVALAEPERFVRTWRRGRSERKVAISLMAPWLQDGELSDARGMGEIRRFARRHLERRPWQPSPRALALARQIVEAPALVPGLLQLYLESRALELVGEALAHIADQPAAPPRPPSQPRERQRILALCEHLAGGAADGWTLARIARHAGMSVATLQRSFRAVTGHSVCSWLREHRLQRARQALAAGAPVAEATVLAGYTSAANFATAFRRRYGITPSQARDG